MALSLDRSSNTCQSKYDVFLSFRGEGNRNKFTSHLHKALLDKQIETFVDDKLNRGDEISPSLLKAIEESRISIIILCKDYASSRWCLEELVKILECRQNHRQIVIPVFYGIDPSHVRNQSGNFAVAFAKHQQRAKIVSLDQGQRWKDALKEAANLSGFDSGVYENECELIEAIVQDVSKRLNDQLPSTDASSHLVGIHSHMESLLCLGPEDVKLDIESLLCLGSEDVKLDIESLLCLGSEDVKWIESQRNRDQSSHLQANWPMKTKHNTPRDAYHVLLIAVAVILAITFYAALIAPGKLVDNIKSSSSSSSSLGFQRSNYLLRLFIWFDSIAFITSAASMIIILMHENPLKPWMLISVLSIYGAYICLIIAASPRDALPVFLLGSPTILLASMSKHLALHSTLLKPLQFLWVRVYKKIKSSDLERLQECPSQVIKKLLHRCSKNVLNML